MYNQKNKMMFLHKPNLHISTLGINMGFRAAALREAAASTQQNKTNSTLSLFISTKLKCKLMN